MPYRKINKGFRFRFRMQKRVLRFSEIVTFDMRSVFAVPELIPTFAVPKQTRKQAIEWSFVSPDKCNFRRYKHGIMYRCMRF